MTIKIYMDPSFRTKWATALRSGDYKQTSGRLKDDYGYCCLGVLCNVYDPNKWNEWRYIYKAGESEEFSAEFIPPSLEKILFYADIPEYNSGEPNIISEELAELNDAGVSFEYIADIVDRMDGETDLRDMIKNPAGIVSGVD